MEYMLLNLCMKKVEIPFSFNFIKVIYYIYFLKKSSITGTHKCKHLSQFPARVIMYIILFQILILVINPHTFVNIALLVFFVFLGSFLVDPIMCVHVFKVIFLLFNG